MTDGSCRRRAWEATRSTTRSLDWPLTILIVAFILVAPIFGGASGGFDRAMRRLAGLVVTTPMEAYEQSIVAAAVKRPDYGKKLQTVDTSKATVKLVTFRRPGNLPAEKRDRVIWASLADELRTACKGARDPLRELQHVLGLPPVRAADYVVTELEVAPADLFRPCFAGGDIAKNECQLASPKQVSAESSGTPHPAPNEQGDTGTEQKDSKVALERLAALQGKYDQLSFVANQMWDSYRIDFKRPDGTPDYGYPFTGMGWTYNWSTRSKDHVGVTEFIVRREPKITVGKDIKPAEFCVQPPQQSATPAPETPK